jgi:hypothetical protein
VQRKEEAFTQIHLNRVIWSYQTFPMQSLAQPL